MADQLQPSGVGVYVENQVLFLPKLQNGVCAIGDLWSCQTSRVTGMNLFPSRLTRYELTEARVGSSEFQLHQVKRTRDELKTRKLNGEVSIEMLAGLIKPEASFEYESREASNSVEETLLLHYHVETYKVSVNENGKRRIMEDTIESIRRVDNRDRPTHVVHRILLGGEIRASIRIKSTKVGTNMVANGLAKLNKIKYGPVSVDGRAELKWLDNLDEYDMERKLEVRSVPSSAAGAQNSVEDIFNLLGGFQQTLAAEKHAALKNVYGVPLQFELVPLSTYLDIRPHLLYLEISSFILTQLQDMFLALKDFCRSDHIMSWVLRRCPSFEILLQDPASAFSRRVSEMQKKYSEICQRHLVNGSKTLEGYKRGERSSSELQQVIVSFYEDSNMLEVEQALEDLVAFGQQELPGQPLASANSSVQYFATLAAMESWWATDGPGLKILLVTSSGERERQRETEQRKALATLLRLPPKLNLSSHRNTEIGILVPSCGRQLALKLKFQDKEEEYATDIDRTMRSMEYALVGDPSDYETRFYAIATGRQLPLPADNLYELPHVLFWSRKHFKIVLASSLYDLTKEIRQNVEDGKEWQFVGTLEGAYSSDEVLRTLCVCMETLSSLVAVSQNSRWIVGNFEMDCNNNFDAPLLFVFQRGRLVAACLDHQDIVVLVQSFSKRPESPDLDLLALTQIGIKPFYRDRAQFALGMWAILDDRQQRQQQTQVVNALQHFPDSTDERVATALSVLRALALGGQAGRAHLFKIMAATTAENVPELLDVLKPVFPLIEWSESQDYVLTLLQVDDRLSEWLHAKFPTLGLVWDVSRKLSSDISEANRLVADFPSGFPDDLKSRIQNWVERHGQEEAARRVGRELDTWITEKAVGDSSSKAAIALLRLLNARRQVGSRETLELCKPLINRAAGRDAQELLSSKLDAMDFYGCLDLLSMNRLNPSLVTVLRRLKNVTLTGNSNTHTQSLRDLLCDMCSPHLFKEECIGELWQNPRFRAFMGDSICEDQEMVDILGRHYGKKEHIPAYLPSEVRVKLEGCFKDLERRQLQEPVTSPKECEVLFSRIEQDGTVPDGFTRWLADCLRRNVELQSKLESYDALPHWDKEGKYFEKAWDGESLRRSLERLAAGRVAASTPIRPTRHVCARVHKDSSCDEPDVVKSAVGVNASASAINVAPKFHALTGDQLLALTMRKWTEIREIVPQPRLVTGTPFPVAAVIPYTMQKLKMWGHSVLTADHISRYWAEYGLRRHISAGQDDGSDEEDSPFGVRASGDFEDTTTTQQLNQCPLSRLDILSVLIQISDTTVQEELFRILTQFPVALPVLLPCLDQTDQYDSLLPLLSCGVQKWEQSASGAGAEQRSVENRILSDPYHLILVVRLGASPRHGKSTILNQLFKNKHTFSSASDPGAEFGTPITLSGTVELTCLTEETVATSLWTEHLQHWYASRQQLVLLANLHGECLDHSAAVTHLGQLASHVLVFLMPESRQVHENQLERLTALLRTSEPGVAWDKLIGHMLVDPSYRVADQHSIDMARLIDDSQVGKIRKKIGRALKCDSRSHALSTVQQQQQPNNAIRIRNDSMCQPVKSLVDYIQGSSCAQVRKTLSLQRVPRTTGYENEAGRIWKTDFDLQRIVSLISQVLRLPIRDRVLALARLEKVMAQASCRESEEARRAVLKHKEELNRLITSSRSSEEQKAEKQAQVRRG